MIGHTRTNHWGLPMRFWKTASCRSVFAMRALLLCSAELLPLILGAQNATPLRVPARGWR